jgi:hypothetical protein
MIVDVIIETLEADLDKLAREIEQYEDERELWSIADGITNSAGNLCLHLLGNLNHYIGAKIGNTGYERDRPLEFASGQVSREDLQIRISATRKMVRGSLQDLTDAQLGDTYHGDEGDTSKTLMAELTGIINHFSYHLGQINYHRRLTSGRQK